MERIVNKAIQSVENNLVSFAKFITANDVGATGGHQAGFHFHKNSWPLFFDSPGIKGQNKDVFVTIKWQDDIITTSRFIYYGVGTRDEYRLTRFGRNFPFLTDDNIGDLLIISKCTKDHYVSYILKSDDEIEEFLTVVNLSFTDTNKIITSVKSSNKEDLMGQCFEAYTSSLKDMFPSTSEISSQARLCYNKSYKISKESILEKPDSIILNWLNSEFELFKLLESIFYSSRINTKFKTVEELIETANTILNRRKSRAGKSLEHHLAEIFSCFQIKFDSQKVTEGNKKPDFIFPGSKFYKDQNFKPENLFVLAAKTTCKDRWRQVLNEADRVKIKHLFTLQQGISSNQLEEMNKYGVRLVVPSPYVKNFPLKHRKNILTLSDFTSLVKMRQA